MSGPRPLEGIVVVALEQAVAAPLATRHLADLGARVIKIERPDGGDFARGYDETVRGMSSAFVWLNRSKESITLDLKHPRAPEVLAQLMARADVFVQNLAPGAAGRLGLGARQLRDSHPRLVICEISGYGTHGPYRDKKAYDLLVQGESGIISATGTPESPVKVGISIADVAAGTYAYSGVLATLLGRVRTGQGDIIEVSLFDALAEWMSHLLYYTEYSGAQPRRMGLSHPMIAPYGPFVTGDDKTVLVAVQNEREWRAFCANVLADASIAADGRFTSMSGRVEHRSELDKIISAAVAQFTADELVHRLDRARIASAQVNQVSDLARHPQLEARHRWHEVDSPVGPLRALTPPAVPLGTEARFDPIPGLGEHTEQILTWLGFPESEISGMRTSGLI